MNDPQPTDRLIVLGESERLRPTHPDMADSLRRIHDQAVAAGSQSVWVYVDYNEGAEIHEGCILPYWIKPRSLVRAVDHLVNGTEPDPDDPTDDSVLVDFQGLEVVFTGGGVDAVLARTPEARRVYGNESLHDLDGL